MSAVRPGSSGSPGRSERHASGQLSSMMKGSVVLLSVLEGRCGFNVLRTLGIDLVRHFPGKGYSFVGNAEIKVVKEL